MTTVYLVRHGQSTWNEIGRIQGKQDPPLSSLGRRQVRALASALQDARLSSIYSSPQQRARMTAEVVAKEHNLPVRIVEELAEIDHGHWEGLTESEVQQQFEASFHMWLTQPGQTQMPGGEHCLAVQERVLRTWQDITTRHDGEQILVVSHEIPTKVIIADVLGLPLDRIGQFAVHNAGISVIQRMRDQLCLIRLNERCHLNAVSGDPAKSTKKVSRSQ